jgi:hypothetical protein
MMLKKITLYAIADMASAEFFVSDLYESEEEAKQNCEDRNMTLYGPSSFVVAVRYPPIKDKSLRKLMKGQVGDVDMCGQKWEGEL